jgi:hypothetical protein
VEAVPSQKFGTFGFVRVGAAEATGDVTELALPWIIYGSSAASGRVGDRL